MLGDAAILHLAAAAVVDTLYFAALRGLAPTRDLSSVAKPGRQVESRRDVWRGEMRSRAWQAVLGVLRVGGLWLAVSLLATPPSVIPEGAPPVLVVSLATALCLVICVGATAGSWWAGAALVTVVLPGLEELFFRGLLLSSLGGTTRSVWAAVLAQALWFVADHSGDSQSSHSAVLRLGRALVYGAVAADPRWGVPWSWALHAAYNCAMKHADGSVSVPADDWQMCVWCGARLGAVGAVRYNCVVCVTDAVYLCPRCHEEGGGQHKARHGGMEREVVMRAPASPPRRVGAMTAEDVLWESIRTADGDVPCLGRWSGVENGWEWIGYGAVRTEVARCAAVMGGRLAPSSRQAWVGLVQDDAPTPEGVLAEVTLLVMGGVVVVHLPGQRLGAALSALQRARRQLDAVIVCRRDVEELTATFDDSGVLAPAAAMLDWEEIREEAAGLGDGGMVWRWKWRGMLARWARRSSDDDESPRVVIFTSGSTGRPRPAILPDRVIAASCTEDLTSIRPLTVPHCFPPHHSFAMRQTVRVIANGGRLGCVDPAVPALRAALSALRPSLVAATPLFWATVRTWARQRRCHEGSQVRVKNPLGNRVRVAITGGALTPESTLTWLRASYPQVADGYASTETGTALLDGRPAPGTSVVLVDADARGVGELCVRSEYQFGGYLGGGGASRFVEVEGRRYVRTGDLARGVASADGEVVYTIVGRAGITVKLSDGEFVSLEALEATVESTAAVHMALAWAAPGWEGIAVVVDAGESGSAPEARRAVMDLVAEGAIPAVLQVVVAAGGFSAKNGLLTSDHGKKCRPAIVRRYLSEMTRSQAAVLSDGPAEVPEPLRRLVGGVLAYEINAGVSGNTMLYELGLNSILGMQLSAGVERTFGCVIAPSFLLQHSLAAVWDEITRLVSGTDADLSAPPSAPQRNWTKLCESPKTVLEYLKGLKTSRRKGRGALLTGGTGFLGPYLTRSLSTAWAAAGAGRVFVLVRGRSAAHAERRFRENATKYGVDVAGARVLCGDVSKQGLGLAAGDWAMLEGSVGVVVHNAARVHGVLPMEALAPTNVAGAEEAFIAAARMGAALVHVSSVNVLSTGAEGFPERALGPEDEARLGAMPGYAQSKFIAERRLVALMNDAASRGLPHPGRLAIVRPATLTPAAAGTAVANRECFTSGFLAGTVMLGGYPAGQVPRVLLLTAVDWCADRICGLAMEMMVGCDGPVVVRHANNPRPPLFQDIADAVGTMGYAYRPMADDVWREAVTSMGTDNPLHHFRTDLMCGNVFNRQTASNFRGPDVHPDWVSSCPLYDHTAILRHLGAIADAGLIAQPAPSARAEANLDYNHQFRIEWWYPLLRDITYTTVFVSLDWDVCEAVCRLRRAMLQAATSGRTRGEFHLRVAAVGVARGGGKVQSGYSVDEDQHVDGCRVVAKQCEHDPALEELRRQLDVAVGQVPGWGGFVKLSLRSPKDAAPVQPGAPGARAMINAMRCATGGAVLSLLGASDRVAHDLGLHRADNSPPVVAVREFHDGIDPTWEFRVFVEDGRPTAASQYYAGCRDDTVRASRDQVGAALVSFWCERVWPGLAAEWDGEARLTYDVWVDRTTMQCRLIEINYPPPVANTILFSLASADDCAILEGQAGFELRLCGD